MDKFQPKLEKFNISERYPFILKGLTKAKTKFAEIYNGGIVTRKGSGLRWIRPISVFSNTDLGRDFTDAYQLAYVNFDPETYLDELPTLVPFIGCEMGIKCVNSLCNCSEAFNKLLDSYGNKPYIILRRSFLSNTAFPYITKFFQPNYEYEAELLDKVLHELKQTGLNFTVDTQFLDFTISCVFQKLAVFVENEDLNILGPRIVQNEFGEFYCYSVSFKSDIWENYEIISGLPLNESISPDMIIRFDSGCDSGQLYDDVSCDCRDQFHNALSAIKQEGNGIVIHIPSHDGRGYGMAGKMETELYKAGIAGVIQDPQEPIDTIRAARLLYGDNYDIRTYSGAAQILKALGLTKVRVITDNSEKFKAIKAIGIEVVRVKTETNKEESLPHIQAKQQTPPYNDQAWGEV